MICIFVISLSGWCRTRMRPARLVSYAFLYTTNVELNSPSKNKNYWKSNQINLISIEAMKQDYIRRLRCNI